MASNSNHPIENDSNSTHLPKQAGMMELLAKRVRQAILPLAVLTSGCATIQPPYGSEINEGGKVLEFIPISSDRPAGFEKTKTEKTPGGLVLDLGTPFKVGGKTGFTVHFKMVDTPMGKYPETLLAEKGVKETYEIIDQKTLLKLEVETKQMAEKLATKLYILRETEGAMKEMLNFMKERKPTGFSRYDYAQFFEYLESEIERTNARLGSVGISAMEKKANTAPAEYVKSPEPQVGQSFICYASDREDAKRVAADTFKAKYGKTPEEAGVDLPFEFKESTGKTTVTVMKKLETSATRIPKEPANLVNSELRGGDKGNAVSADIDFSSNKKNVSALKKSGNPESASPAMYMPEIPKTTNGEPVIEIGTGGQNKELIKKLMKIVTGKYENILKRNPTLQGKLTIKFMIGKGGNVETVRFAREKGGLRNEELENAIRNSIETLKFSPDAEGQPIELPIVLTPQG